MFNVTTERVDDAVQVSDRRLFLTRSGVALALLAIAGGESPAAATTLSVPMTEFMPTMIAPAHSVPVPSASVHAVNQVLLGIAQTGSLNKQTPAFASLSPAVQQGLASIPPSVYSALVNGTAAVVAALQAPSGQQIGIGILS